MILLNPSIHSFFSKVKIWKCWMLKSHDVDVGGREKTYYIEFFLPDWWPWDNLIIIQHLSISIAASLKSYRRGFNKTLILHCHCVHVYPVRITVWQICIFWQLNRNSCSNESRFRCSDFPICFPENICETACTACLCRLSAGLPSQTGRREFRV